MTPSTIGKGLRHPVVAPHSGDCFQGGEGATLLYTGPPQAVLSYPAGCPPHPVLTRVQWEETLGSMGYIVSLDKILDMYFDTLPKLHALEVHGTLVWYCLYRIF